jgi:uncharacterized cupin superfamily protein
MNEHSPIRLQQEDADGVTLKPCNLVPAEAVIDGDPKERGAELFTANDGRFVVGMWECTPYAEAFDAYPANEFCQVLKGRVTLTDEQGHSETFVTGDSYLVPEGFRGTFRVEETLLKYYVLGVSL